VSAVLQAPRAVRLEAVAPPQPATGEVLVEIEGCGVCASSLPVWEGRPWFDYPLPPGAPGHEAWGRTADGARVSFLTQQGFAPAAAVDARTLVPLPRELDGLPFPGEALGSAVNVFARAGVLAGERVAIVGMGFIGSALAQLCEAAGAEVVPLRRGAEPRGLACERAIETGGVQATLDLASAVVAERGRLVIAGFHQDGPRNVNMFLWNWRGLDVVNAHERDSRVYVDGIRRAVDAMANGTIDPSPLFTHRYALDEVDAAFAATRDRPDGFIKALVTA
jgi:NADPH:quinone reductase